MSLWLGQLVIFKGTRRGPAYRVQYWRRPSMTPALIGLNSLEDLRRYLKQTRLSNVTPDEVIERLQTASQVQVNTIESEEKIL